MAKSKALIVGSVASFVLLVAFGLLQQAQAPFLALPMQWMAVAILPVIVALFVGGYISRFKGFGVELEAALKQPVVDLTASNAVAHLPGGEKRSVQYLDSLPEATARSIRRLRFVAGRADYYRPGAIVNYLRRLPNLSFLEIDTDSGDIVGFLPVSAVRKPDGQPDREALDRFVQAVEASDLRSSFPMEATTLRVKGEQSLVEVLKKMRSENAECAAVISAEGRYLGMVLAQEVERRIADSVLAAERR